MNSTDGDDPVVFNDLSRSAADTAGGRADAAGREGEEDEEDEDEVGSGLGTTGDEGEGDPAMRSEGRPTRKSHC